MHVQNNAVAAQKSNFVGQATVTKTVKNLGILFTKPVLREILGTSPTAQGAKNTPVKETELQNDTASKARLFTSCTIRKNKGASGKENEVVRSSQRKSKRLANKPNSGLSIQEQAIQLLMKKYGIIDSKNKVGDTNHLKFKTQFMEPLIDNGVDGFREACGLNDLEGGSLSAVVLEADE